MAPFLILVLLLALLGHGFVCVAIFNRVAGSRLPCSMVGRIERACLVLMVVVPMLFAWWSWQYQVFTHEALLATPAGLAWFVYLAFTVLVACAMLPDWLRQRFSNRSVEQLVSNDTVLHDVARELGHWPVGSRSSLFI
ncbi:MAG TPA: hypothetical protein VL096_22210 [Pirellulaceae bacterium]|nr:hypothetical protein [Pirellulaceae bacterium]